MREALPDCQGLSYKERWQCVSIDGEVVQSIALPLQNKSAPQQSCAALKIMLHVLLKGFLDLAPLLEELAAPKRRQRGFVSNKRVHFEPERIKSNLF